MSQPEIICKATIDTFVRFGIVILAVFGFSIYFAYDGAVGYAQKNELYFSYKAFESLGFAAEKTQDADEWKRLRESTPLISAEKTPEGDWYVAEGETHYPLPPDSEVVAKCPPEVQSMQAMRNWHDCWKKYTERQGYDIKPSEHPFGTGKVMEQWVGCAVGFVLVGIGVFFVVRTYRRELSLRGDIVTAAGQQFSVNDITLIDLRQWGTGFKGVAYFTVGGKKIKVDGMTYGGFSQKNGEPAEKFMKAVLEQYKGDILEYE